MANLPRDSTLLPTIKCSTCGGQIEISLMGDHVCSGTDSQEGKSPRRLLDSESLFSDEFIDLFTQDKPLPYRYERSRRPERVPPKVDTNAASEYIHTSHASSLGVPVSLTRIPKMEDTYAQDN